MKHYQKYLVPAVCSWCGKAFQAYKYNVARGWGKHCSRSCSKRLNHNRRGAVLSGEVRKKVSDTLKKKYASGEIVSPFRSQGWIGAKGDKAANWRGGKTLVGQGIRRSLAYKEWRMDVLARDDFTCQLCLVRGGKLHADHIKSFAEHPDLRLELDNGRTLCIPCHRKTETWGARKKTLI